MPKRSTFSEQVRYRGNAGTWTLFDTRYLNLRMMACSVWNKRGQTVHGKDAGRSSIRWELMSAMGYGRNRRRVHEGGYGPRRPSWGSKGGMRAPV